MKRIPGDVFVDKDLANGTPGTPLIAEWHNDVQEELVNVITDVSGGNTELDGESQTQLLEAIQTLVSNALADIQTDRIWVRFDGIAGGTIVAGSGVSAITRHGVGDYELHFAITQPDANYGVLGTCSDDTTRGGMIAVYEVGGVATLATTSVRVRTHRAPNNGGIVADQRINTVEIIPSGA
ncbi:hypothetical protein [Magnetococcus sp. PR-3]|uniref:hypothetical protein n=1 Tax=Magnetococcus sp. PR-3 TaxID=3120355 RepID=UPI002FCE1C7F